MEGQKMDSTIKIYKWWWAWNYDQIENWLEEMALQGYVLMDVKGIGTHFYFEKAKPLKCRFCIDFQPRINKDYLQIIIDDGWEIYPMGFGWYVWSKVYEDQRPHLYSDYDSIIRRNNKLLILILLCCVPLVLGTINILSNFSKVTESLTTSLTIGFVYAAIWIFEIFIISALLYSNKIIKKKKEFRH